MRPQVTPTWVPAGPPSYHIHARHCICTDSDFIRLLLNRGFSLARQNTYCSGWDANGGGFYYFGCCCCYGRSASRGYVRLVKASMLIEHTYMRGSSVLLLPEDDAITIFTCSQRTCCLSVDQCGATVSSLALVLNFLYFFKKRNREKTLFLSFFLSPNRQTDRKTVSAPHTHTLSSACTAQLITNISGSRRTARKNPNATPVRRGLPHTYVLN
jgi:hypothetical protein